MEDGWGVDVPVVPHGIHYSIIPKHKMYIYSKYQCMHVNMLRYVHMNNSNALYAETRWGQTPEKRHLGCESSGALVCRGEFKQDT